MVGWMPGFSFVQQRQQTPGAGAAPRVNGKAIAKRRAANKRARAARRRNRS